MASVCPVISIDGTSLSLPAMPAKPSKAAGLSVASPKSNKTSDNMTMASTPPSSFRRTSRSGSDAATSSKSGVASSKASSAANSSTMSSSVAASATAWRSTPQPETRAPRRQPDETSPRHAPMPATNARWDAAPAFALCARQLWRCALLLPNFCQLSESAARFPEGRPKNCGIFVVKLVRECINFPGARRVF